MTSLYKLYEQYPLVTTDSRNVTPGCLFFALRGPSFDGNRYAAQALRSGAVKAVVDDPAVAVSDDYILVDDVLGTLQKLATYHRRVLKIPVLAITGTNGKTTTKELLARVLGQRYKVAATVGNLNNHIGVPLTLLSIPHGTEFAVIEMGAGSRGEIGLLCSIAQPDYGLVTNIGKAHLEGFGDLEGVRSGKGELYDYLLAHHGIAFYRTEDPVLNEMIAEKGGILSKGYSDRLADDIRSHLEGDYNKYNIAAAVAVGEYFGITQGEITAAIEGYVPSNHRSQVVDTGRNTVIVDCYNANPSSMKAAVDNFAELDTPKDKLLILGDMLELGKHSSDEHVAVIKLIADNNLKDVILVGDNFKDASDGTGLHSFEDAGSLAGYLRDNPVSGKMILLKGSRGIALDRILELL